MHSLPSASAAVRKFHTSPFPYGCPCRKLFPEACCSRLIYSQARVAMDMGLAGASCDSVQSFFFKEKGNQRSQPSSCFLELPFFSYFSMKA